MHSNSDVVEQYDIWRRTKPVEHEDAEFSHGSAFNYFYKNVYRPSAPVSSGGSQGGDAELHACRNAGGRRYEEHKMALGDRVVGSTCPHCRLTLVPNHFAAGRGGA